MRFGGEGVIGGSCLFFLTHGKTCDVWDSVVRAVLANVFILVTAFVF